MTSTDEARQRGYYQATVESYHDRCMVELRQQAELLKGIRGADLLGSLSHVAIVATCQNTAALSV